MSQPVLPFIATEMIPISFKKDLNLKFFLIWFLDNLCDCSNPKLFQVRILETLPLSKPPPF
jgi:hypothetical protein